MKEIVTQNGKIYGQQEIYALLPFCKKKTQQLLREGIIPAVKIGRGYIITEKALLRWLDENAGREVFV